MITCNFTKLSNVMKLHNIYLVERLIPIACYIFVKEIQLPQPCQSSLFDLSWKY